MKLTLTRIQAPKLRLAAEMLKATAHLYNPTMPNLLPLWGGGIISHGQPKSTALVIGISCAAQKQPKGTAPTRDHLYRVTQTAATILAEIQNNPGVFISEIEQMLIGRAVYMEVTQAENVRLRNAAKAHNCKPDQIFLPYRLAKINYKFLKPVVMFDKSSGTAYVPDVEDSPDFWRILEDIIHRLIPGGIKEIIFRHAPNGIPIPQRFRDFCEKHGIEIVLLAPENFDDQLAEAEISTISQISEQIEIEAPVD